MNIIVNPTFMYPVSIVKNIRLHLIRNLHYDLEYCIKDYIYEIS